MPRATIFESTDFNLDEARKGLDLIIVGFVCYLFGFLASPSLLIGWLFIVRGSTCAGRHARRMRWLVWLSATIPLAFYASVRIARAKGQRIYLLDSVAEVFVETKGIVLAPCILVLFCVACLGLEELSHHLNLRQLRAVTRGCRIYTVPAVVILYVIALLDSGKEFAGLLGNLCALMTVGLVLLAILLRVACTRIKAAKLSAGESRASIFASDYVRYSSLTRGVLWIVMGYAVGTFSPVLSIALTMVFGTPTLIVIHILSILQYPLYLIGVLTIQRNYSKGTHLLIACLSIAVVYLVFTYTGLRYIRYRHPAVGTWGSVQILLFALPGILASIWFAWRLCLFARDVALEGGSEGLARDAIIVAVTYTVARGVAALVSASGNRSIETILLVTNILLNLTANAALFFLLVKTFQECRRRTVADEGPAHG